VCVACAGEVHVSGNNSAVLRELLCSEYDNFSRRLGRRLGSIDLAKEALHETFLRMDRVSETVTVRNAVSYIFRMALNVAEDRRRSDSKLLNASEIALILDVPDEAPDAYSIVAGRAEFDEFGKALSELSERRQAVFKAVHVEHLSHQEIATRFGINVRTVAFDLQHTMEHLSRRLGRKAIRRFGPRAGAAD
jgi:RNA polymerase sigma-70 factor, ECF subfamily